MSGRRIVIGVGNAYRGDDAVGLAVAERARGAVPRDVVVLRTSLRDIAQGSLRYLAATATLRCPVPAEGWD